MDRLDADPPGEVDAARTSHDRPAAAEPFVHDALFYTGPDEFLDGTLSFLDAGRERGEPALVAVPRAKIGLLRSRVRGSATGVEFIDMNELGRNPSRIIPAVRDWVDRQQAPRCRFVGEPIWPGRTASETVEATRHEALINLAFADAAVTILCPYDTSRLDRAVVDDAERTHPHVIRSRRRLPSPRYANPLTIWAAAQWPLTEPQSVIATARIDADLLALRRFTAAAAREAGLGDRRIADFVLATNEAATNALVHGDDGGELRIWRDGTWVICEISAAGRLADPLAGRRLPAPDSPRGRGLWLTNQLCDLVELRSGESGTTIRLHVETEPTEASPPSRWQGWLPRP